VTLRIGIANARCRSRTYSSTLAPFPGRAASAIAAIRSGTSTSAAGLQEDLYTERTVARLTRMLCAENARRAYRLGDQT